jgi:putative ABC transport system ATP-binding protein
LETVCELVDINKSYAGKQVLDKFSLSIRQGELVAITGKSGSGKTTVMNIIGLLEKPDSGAVTLFGKENPYTNSSQVTKILRTKLSYLFQNFALMDNETISKNLDVALVYSKKPKREKEEFKKNALSLVGLDLSMNQRVCELSGGEQQRVALARLLLKPCELILADEPTGSLDAENRDEIIKTLKVLNDSGKTIIIVTHDSAVANMCDRVIHLT